MKCCNTLKSLAILLSVLICTGATTPRTRQSYTYIQVGVFSHTYNAGKLSHAVAAVIHLPLHTLIDDLHRTHVLLGPMTSPEETLHVRSLLQRHGFTTETKLFTAPLNAHNQPQPLAWTEPRPTARPILIAPPHLDEVDSVNKLHAHITGITEHDTPQLSTEQVKLLTLRDAIWLALRYDPSVQNAEIDRIIQKFNLRVAQNEFELQYALSGDYGYSRSKASGIRSADSRSGNVSGGLTIKNRFGSTYSATLDNSFSGKSYNPGLTLSVSQPLLRGFGPDIVLQGLHNAYDAELSNRINLRQTISDQVDVVALAYRSLVQDNNTLDTQRRSLQDAQKTFTVNKEQIKAGRLASTTNVEQESQIQTLRLSLQQAINKQQQDQQQLLSDIGLNPDFKIKVPNNIDIPQLAAPNLAHAIALGLHNNTKYQNALLKYKSDQRNLLLQHNNQLPQLDLDASTTLGNGSGMGADGSLPSIYNGRNRNENVSLKLTIPVNDLDRQKQLVQAKIDIEKQNIALQREKRELITRIKQEVFEIKSQITELKIAQREVELSRKSYELELVKLRVGRSTPINVTNTQNKLIGSQVGLIGNKISYLSAVDRLNNDIGVTLDKWQVKLGY